MIYYYIVTVYVCGRKIKTMPRAKARIRMCPLRIVIRVFSAAFLMRWECAGLGHTSALRVTRVSAANSGNCDMTGVTTTAENRPIIFARSHEAISHHAVQHLVAKNVDSLQKRAGNSIRSTGINTNSRPESPCSDGLSAQRCVEGSPRLSLSGESSYRYRRKAAEELEHSAFESRISEVVVNENQVGTSNEIIVPPASVEDPLASQQADAVLTSSFISSIAEDRQTEPSVVAATRILAQDASDGPTPLACFSTLPIPQNSWDLHGGSSSATSQYCGDCLPSDKNCDIAAASATVMQQQPSPYLFYDLNSDTFVHYEPIWDPAQGSRWEKRAAPGTVISEDMSRIQRNVKLLKHYESLKQQRDSCSTSFYSCMIPSRTGAAYNVAPFSPTTSPTNRQLHPENYSEVLGRTRTIVSSANEYYETSTTRTNSFYTSSKMNSPSAEIFDPIPEEQGDPDGSSAPVVGSSSAHSESLDETFLEKIVAHTLMDADDPSERGHAPDADDPGDAACDGKDHPSGGVPFGERKNHASGTRAISLSKSTGAPDTTAFDVARTRQQMTTDSRDNISPQYSSPRSCVPSCEERHNDCSDSDELTAEEYHQWSLLEMDLDRTHPELYRSCVFAVPNLLGYASARSRGWKTALRQHIATQKSRLHELERPPTRRRK